MPINQTIWKISDRVEQVREKGLDREDDLEEILMKNIKILADNSLIVGRQVPTKYGKRLDLLAIDNNGSLVILELKRERTARETVAQGIDYASWVKSLTPSDVSDIFEAYDEKYLKSGKTLDAAFVEKFGFKLEDEDVNTSHQIVIVASELDTSTERIIAYLDSSSVPINFVSFKIFGINNEKYLSRAWFMDPFESGTTVTVGKTSDPWNGEYYVSFGEYQDGRNWDDAKKFGFISAGGGPWYSRTLSQLSEGDRIWVNIPHVGYVGVGRVKETMQKAGSARFKVDGKELTLNEIKDKKGNYHQNDDSDDDNAEYVVKVDWTKTVDKSKAVKETGFFGNQNTVCKPTVNRWVHTIERLKQIWEVD
jgi:hypothetical protein